MILKDFFETCQLELGRGCYFSTKLAKLLNHNEAALFISYLLYHTGSDRFPDGKISKSYREIYDDLNISERCLDSVRTKLKNLGYLTETFNRRKNEMIYQINLEKLSIDLMSKYGTEEEGVSTKCTDLPELSTDLGAASPPRPLDKAIFKELGRVGRKPTEGQYGTYSGVGTKRTDPPEKLSTDFGAILPLRPLDEAVHKELEGVSTKRTDLSTKCPDVSTKCTEGEYKTSLGVSTKRPFYIDKEPSKNIREKETKEKIFNLGFEEEVPEPCKQLIAKIIEKHGEITYHALYYGCKWSAEGQKIILTVPSEGRKRRIEDRHLMALYDYIRQIGLVTIQFKLPDTAEKQSAAAPIRRLEPKTSEIADKKAANA